ncbi:MAG TPA: hypothetical protein H9894_04560 [Candidatus Desulfovibrio intestinipullorum]|uniref:DUF1490 family protein n=1 Tax=Candidatus Desulfovibrio intestinipullorum TaxID=2838536 RepID=A0A9D1TPV1_9BACT|nr:hypothetical protein [Candidatus Desulfovibrio intestinipullorum]
MNTGLKYALFFVGGIAAGVLGTMALQRGAINLKPVAAGIISRGMDVKDAIAGAVEKVKEDAQDLYAEAKAEQAQRKEQDA